LGSVYASSDPTLTTRCPRCDKMGTLTQPTFVDEDYRGDLLLRLFLMPGQILRLQWPMASSLLQRPPRRALRTPVQLV
jgi:hypothetical protein